MKNKTITDTSISKFVRWQLVSAVIGLAIVSASVYLEANHAVALAQDHHETLAREREVSHRPDDYGAALRLPNMTADA